jgi:hypothetical protein
VPLVVADTANPDSGGLPAIIVVDFRNGDIKPVANATDDGLQNLALSLEVHVFRDTQADRANTNIHRKYMP